MRHSYAACPFVGLTAQRNAIMDPTAAKSNMTRLRRDAQRHFREGRSTHQVEWDSGQKRAADVGGHAKGTKWIEGDHSLVKRMDSFTQQEQKRPCGGKSTEKWNGIGEEDATSVTLVRDSLICTPQRHDILPNCTRRLGPSFGNLISCISN